MIKKDYLIYVHNLRGLAILIIVAIHTRIALFGGSDTSFLNRTLIIFLDNGTIIFVFISGFLFHHVFIPKFRYGEYLINKISYVLLPYLLISALPIINKLFLDDSIRWMTPGLEAMNKLDLVIYMLFTGKHFGPFWFIPMIMIFYILAPILIKLNTRIFYSYFFPVIFVLGLFTYQFGFYSTILDSFIFYLPIYLLGMVISQYKKWIFKNDKWIFPVLMILYLLLVVLELEQVVGVPKMIGFNSTDLAYFIFNPSKLQFSMMAVILLIAFHRFTYLKLRLFWILGDYSFGIYFVHLFFIIFIQKVFNYYQIELPKSLVTFLLLSLFSISCSIFYVWIIKIMFRNKSRYIVGS